MVKPSPALLGALRPLLDAEATAELDRELAKAKPDLTNILLRAARQASSPLDRTLLAAACRAACALLRQRHPGATIELRVPPFAAVQIGFGTGPKHTRGTPPNVVEFEPQEFLDLVVGKENWASRPRRASGVHADEAAAAFPLIS
ncbi:sterol carrier family protein [Tessaracoccus caeni]|uniref:sterol carrier family protein n=1 Tax=Tessaracoccus caeni TaxID=3031239 RepID=UPI0023DB9008|nr:sterol carrier family protein [Tessaracoccus caeni]MDF1486909.1 sterol carrier family protein [Tessaracoccus caeni]